MSTTLRRFRGPLIALIALIFSASIAFAGQPESPGADGRANASTHAGKTVPVVSDEETEQDEDTETETPDGDSGDHCNVDLTQDPEALAELNHGSVVCTAAHADTPEGFDNHGAYVSSFAKSKSHGSEASANGQGHKPSN